MKDLVLVIQKGIDQRQTHFEQSINTHSVYLDGCKYRMVYMGVCLKHTVKLSLKSGKWLTGKR